MKQFSENEFKYVAQRRVESSICPLPSFMRLCQSKMQPTFNDAYYWIIDNIKELVDHESNTNFKHELNEDNTVITTTYEDILNRPIRLTYSVAMVRYCALPSMEVEESG